jgi:hypothetical protein
VEIRLPFLEVGTDFPNNVSIRFMLERVDGDKK